MKIAHINMVHNGSTGKIMFGISETAENLGFSCKTFTPKLYTRKRTKHELNIKNHYQWGSTGESFVHYYLGTLLGINGKLSYFGTKKLIKELDKFNPDVVHIHNLHNFSINLKLLFNYFKKKNVHVVWTLHDCWAFTGHCPYFDKIKCDKWKTGCFSCPQKLGYPKSYIDTSSQMYKFKKKLFTGINNLTIVTPSKWLAGLVKQSFLSNYPVKVINNGIDLSVFKPTDNNLKKTLGCEGKHLVLSVAFDWDERKGIDVFIELASKLNDNYQILLIGTDDNVDSTLPSNVISVHRTENQQELAEYYTAADVFVIPTREDNYPTVNMEALACGTPVVTFDTGGSPEMVDSTCGAVVDVNDIDGLVLQIERICEGNTISHEACLKKAESFNMLDRFREYVELYTSL